MGHENQAPQGPNKRRKGNVQLILGRRCKMSFNKNIFVSPNESFFVTIS